MNMPQVDLFVFRRQRWSNFGKTAKRHHLIAFGVQEFKRLCPKSRRKQSLSRFEVFSAISVYLCDLCVKLACVPGFNTYKLKLELQKRAFYSLVLLRSYICASLS